MLPFLILVLLTNNNLQSKVYEIPNKIYEGDYYMKEVEFLDNFLWPSTNRLNKTFIHPLPNIDGLEKCGEFLLQSELEGTFTPTVITKYVSDLLGVRLIDVYRNTQHKDAEVFVRLVGTINLVKMGYPFLSLDAAVSNINLLTGAREDLTTRVRISLPQADLEQRELFFPSLTKRAKESDIQSEEMQFKGLPDFYGPIWIAESEGLNLDIIHKLRNIAWSSYKGLFEQTTVKTPFNYRPLQEQMLFNAAKLEESLFRSIGLSVPVEAYAALFGVLVSPV
jgi:hypothetical protein